MLASVYGVPDVDAGDQIMAAVVLRDGVAFDPDALAAWIDAQPDLSPKWRPRYIRLARVLPTTPTNKVLTRTLVHQKFRADRIGGDPVFVRGRGEDAYRPFGPDAEAALHDAFVAAGRDQAWEL
jgi:fatty-acyl-CoA synthase